MIDWVTAVLPCRHFQLPADTVIKHSPTGEIHWETRCRVQVAGTHSSTISVKSDGVDETNQGTISHILVSGNPSKFLQGHNIFGSDDIVSLMYDTFLKIIQLLDITPDARDLKKVKCGDYELKIVDINYSFELRNRADVLSVIRAMEYKSKTRHGRPSMKGSTLYWGQSSARWALKTYSKGEEIEAKNHQLPIELKDTKLAEWADNKMRIELRLKHKELTDLNILKANDLSIEIAQKLFKKYVRRIDMTDQIALSDDKQMSIPNRLRSTYILWKNGDDLRSILPKATYYRHRKDMRNFGINIDLRQDTSPKRNVIPLIRILEAKPAQIPEWAFSQKLIHRSATR